jgi:hypothetical protein
MIVILGLWTAIIGYGVLYSGVAKLGGDPSYKLGDAFRGKSPSAAPASGGAGVGGGMRRNFGVMQQSMIGTEPMK